MAQDAVIRVVLEHESGVKFNLNLTAAEIERFNNDQAYANEVSNKYYSLYLQGVVRGVVSGEEDQEASEEETSLFEEAHAATSGQRRNFRVADEEILIRLVSERPPLFNFSLPLRERSRQITRGLWDEIITELDVNVSVEEISKKWKNIRDSFMRVRANIKRKIASGSSAKQKLQAEKLKKTHSNYDLLMFLDDSLSTRGTSSNLESNIQDEASSQKPRIPETPSEASLRNPGIPETPSTSRASRSSNQDQISAQDQAFLDTIKQLPGPRELTPTQNFCLRLANGMDKLPPRVRNQLQVEFLTRLTELENEYEL